MGDDRTGTKRAQQRRATEARILAAARREFAAAGYDRTTIRVVAEAAGVNPGLVMHYFVSKVELFRRAASAAPDAADTTAPERDLAELLLDSLGVKLDGLPLASTAALRSMLTHPDAASDVQDRISKQMRQLAAAIPGQDASLRATLVGTTILGVVVGRHLLGLDHLRDAPADQILDLLRPCFQLLAEYA